MMVRPEQDSDNEAVRHVLKSSFGRSEEADLVEVLRRQAPATLSLVALIDDQVVGHILFSPVVARSRELTIEGMGLAPMAVLPEMQRQGVGSELVKEGLRILTAEDCPFVVVLGHHAYYPRFGFVPASTHGLACQWDEVPDEVFMVRELRDGALDDFQGTVFYRDEFNQFD